MNIAIGSDHRGFNYKTRLIDKLRNEGHRPVDCGCPSAEAADYPVAALEVGRQVAAGECSRGILICGSGIGMSIAANKVAGVRASLCASIAAARMTVQHNDSNVLCLSGDSCPWELVSAMVDAWLVAEFEGGRHGRRVDQIVAYENVRQDG